MKKEGIKLFIVALASFLMLVCIVAAAPDSTPANYTQEQDFTWGVLAINTHKSIYLPNEAASIGIAVLDNEGHMVCDADVTLTITDPSDNETVLSTSNGLINVSPQCCVYGVTNLPDYYTNYTVGGAGTYVMNLTVTAVTADGTKSITDEFTVQNSVDFDVARDGATRIYPPVPYVMNFTIKANKDYTGLIKEYVPASFVITPQDGLTVTTVGDTDTKILTWTRNLVEGETYNIYYEFDAPDISPYLFTLGALEIGSFKEVRQWQIANDATVTYFFNAYDINEVWTDPSYMTNGNIENYAYTNTKDKVQLLNANTCPVIDLGPISKVELQAYGYTADNDYIYIRPVFTGGDGDNHEWIPGTSAAWSGYFGITSDSYAPASWTWTDVENLDVDIQKINERGPDNVFIAKVEIRVTYAPPTWDSYKTDYPDQEPPGTQCDVFDDYNTEHRVYMYGVGFTNGGSYKVVYWLPDDTRRTVDTGLLVEYTKLKSTWEFVSQGGEGNWHVTVYNPSDHDPGSTYSASDSHIVADDKSYTDATSFYVSLSAIPEFPTVIAAIAVCMLCAVAYMVTRRRAGRGDG